ncbi:PREDICTED: N-acetyl-D-glucosamine kinase-like [Erythranthe guttata]|uniref:N-acetyl-D-glucosamine kinase-like n=1 Tax=Erythranthe guttata TaxID=4155 RepID=UPI00064DA4AE|nr:PREDICTED: N-acetyl-D-glucosamine kinase-like [Erythranthe guttata]|eukprot:XP_012830491.1 PREDICTED: N-acetyl-D-glucosamine kinase-like [Erythranthe guttata]
MEYKSTSWFQGQITRGQGSLLIIYIHAYSNIVSQKRLVISSNSLCACNPRIKNLYYSNPIPPLLCRLVDFTYNQTTITSNHLSLCCRPNIIFLNSTIFNPPPRPITQFFNKKKKKKKKKKNPVDNTLPKLQFFLIFYFGISEMKRYRNRRIWDFEHELKMVDRDDDDVKKVILGIDGGTAHTVCICMPFIPFTHHLPDPLPVLARTVAGCSNHNSVGETAARESLEQVMADALARSRSTRSSVEAVCLSVSGVNHPTDQHRILNWLREIFASDVRLFVENDAVAALASGTMGKLHGCVLIAGTGTIAYGFTEDGRQARAAGAGPVLGDWGSGYGIAAQALTAVIRAHDGRGPLTTLTNSILDTLKLSSPDQLIGWTYADPSWARIAELLPVVVSCADAMDPVAIDILYNSVHELASSVKAVVERLELCGEDGKDEFPLVMVGSVLEANKRWDIGNQVMSCISKDFPGVLPIRPKVRLFSSFSVRGRGFSDTIFIYPTDKAIFYLR